MKKIGVDLDYSSTRHPSDDTLGGRPRRSWITIETKRLNKVSAGFGFTANTVRRGRAGQSFRTHNTGSLGHTAHTSKEHDGESQHQPRRRTAAEGLPHANVTVPSPHTIRPMRSTPRRQLHAITFTPSPARLKE